MRLRWQWLLVSVCGAVLVAVFLFAFTGDWVGPDLPAPLASLVKVVFWPVTVLVSLSGPGSNIGPPDKHWHEGTPVQFFAVVLGIGLSWFFYSSLVFLLLWVRQRRLRTPISKSF